MVRVYPPAGGLVKSEKRDLNRNERKGENECAAFGRPGGEGCHLSSRREAAAPEHSAALARNTDQRCFELE